MPHFGDRKNMRFKPCKGPHTTIGVYIQLLWKLDIDSSGDLPREAWLHAAGRLSLSSKAFEEEQGLLKVGQRDFKNSTGTGITFYLAGSCYSKRLQTALLLSYVCMSVWWIKQQKHPMSLLMMSFFLQIPSNKQCIAHASILINGRLFAPQLVVSLKRMMF